MAEKIVPPFQSYASRSSHNSPKSPGKSLYVVLFLLLLIIIGIGAAQYLTSQSDDMQNSGPTAIEFEDPKDMAPTPTPESAITPTSTPSANTDLDRSNLSIVILNGSGVSGAAKKLSDALTKLGYEIESTGNADSSDYDSTEIEISNAKKNFLNILKEDLENDYTVGDTTTTYTGEGDAQIIIGAE
jgi:hypothetical protein